MISFSRVRARTFDLAYIDLFWEMEDTADNSWEYRYHIHRSEAREGPYTQLTSAAKPINDSTFRFRDGSVDLTDPQLAVATQEVFHGQACPSRLVLPVDPTGASSGARSG